MRRKIVWLLTATVLCLGIGLGFGFVYAAEDAFGFSSGGAGDAVISPAAQGTTLSSASGTDFSAKSERRLGINGATVTFSANLDASRTTGLWVMLSPDKTWYGESRAFGMLFVPEGADRAKASLALSDGMQITQSAEVSVPFSWKGTNSVKFWMPTEFNAASYAGLWRVSVGDTVLRDEIGAQEIEQVQSAFTDGLGCFQLAVQTEDGEGNLTVTEMSSAQAAFTNLNDKFAGAREVWSSAFANGVNTPILAGYGRGGYIEMTPGHLSGSHAGEFTVFRQDKTYTLDGIELTFDFYSKEGEKCDFRIMFSVGSDWKFGFFIRRGTEADTANISVYTNDKESGSVKNVPFSFDGTNTLKLYRNDDQQWKLVVNGREYLDKATSDLIEADVTGKFTNEQANLYFWDADASTTNRFALRTVTAPNFSGVPSGWAVGAPGASFELSSSGNVLVSAADPEGNYGAIRDEESFSLSKFTHHFAVHKPEGETGDFDLVLSSVPTWYATDEAVMLTFRYSKKVAGYHIYSVLVSIWENGEKRELAEATTSKFNFDALNMVSFGKTLSGWVVRLNKTQLEFDRDFSETLDSFSANFTKDVCYLQVQNAGGGSYEFSRAYSTLAQLNYPSSWVPGGAGGSDFAEPTVEGEEVLIPPTDSLTYSGVKIDRKVLLDGFEMKFTLERSGGDDGKHFGIILANSSSWYQNCKSIMFMFRPKGIAAGETCDKATFSVAYSDKDKNIDLSGDQSMGGKTQEVIFHWQGENTISFVYDAEAKAWKVTVNGQTFDTELGVTTKMKQIASGYTDNEAYLQIWNGEAFTVFGIKELTEIAPPQSQPLISGSFNFLDAKIGETLTIDCTELFVSTDGTPLSFSCEAGTLSGNIWTYTPSEEGWSFIELTAASEGAPELKAVYLVAIRAVSGDSLSKAGCGSFGSTAGGIGMLAVVLCGISIYLTIQKKEISK